MTTAREALETQLSKIIQPWNMLDSKFYRAWSDGTLPIEGLKLYAHEYGAFIKSLPAGWTSQGDIETAHEEEEHIELWDKFAAALETKIGEAKLPAVKNLVDTAERLFANPVTALGALYAFEVQQPATSVSKLDGLRKHYKIAESAETYFITHSHNEHEAEKLLRRIEVLNSSDQDKALSACDEMAKALREALDGMCDSVHCC